MEPRPSVIVLAGPNGAGKSTVAPFLLRGFLDVRDFVNADVIAAEQSPSDPASVAVAAGREMLSRLHDLARQRRSFAFESTLASRSLAGWLADLIQTGYSLHILFLWLPTPEAALERVARRVRAGGHGVPEAVVRRRYARGLHNFFRLYQPLTTTWILFDSSDASDAPGRQARAPIAAGNGRTISLIRDQMTWSRIQRDVYGL